MKNRIVSFPWMGKDYTLLIKKIFENELGLNVLLPPEVNAKTVQYGVKHSSDMMCFPYKTTLGNMIEALHMGANTLIMYDNCGQCRQRQYGKIQEFTLKNLGFKEFEFYSVNFKNIVGVLAKISGKSRVTVIKALYKMIKGFQEIDKHKYVWSKDGVNIGIIGEIYTCVEEKANYDIEKKLRQFGVHPYNSATLGHFATNRIKEALGGFMFAHKSNKHKKEAMKYLNGPVGGHSVENLYNLFWFKEQGVDGVIHLLPLSCMPECTIEPIVNHICQENDIPLLRLPIDETNSEANVATRVETFVELIKRKKKSAQKEADSAKKVKIESKKEDSEETDADEKNSATQRKLKAAGEE